MKHQHNHAQTTLELGKALLRSGHGDEGRRYIEPDITWRTARLSLSDSWPFTNIMCSVQAMLLKAKEFLNTDNALRIFPASVIQTRLIAHAGVAEEQLRPNKKFL